MDNEILPNNLSNKKSLLDLNVVNSYTQKTLDSNKFKFLNRDFSELKDAELSFPKNNYFTNFARELKKNKLAMFSMISLIIIIICSIFAFLSPYDPNKIDISNRLSPPTFKNLFGTDELGRDYFTRILYGGRVSLTVGFLAMIMSTFIGTFVGTFSGFNGGLLDKIIMRSIDILMCIPTFFLMLIANAYLKPGLENIIIIIGIFGWMGIARIVRSETLSYKEREYVLAGKAMGGSNGHLIKKHILPNVLPTIIVISSINIAGAILTESSLSFLGLGVQAPTASWGSMLQSAQNYLSQAPFLAIFPGMIILITVLSFNILGDVLRTSMEPKISRK